MKIEGFDLGGEAPEGAGKMLAMFVAKALKSAATSIGTQYCMVYVAAAVLAQKGEEELAGLLVSAASRTMPVPDERVALIQRKMADALASVEGEYTVQKIISVLQHAESIVESALDADLDEEEDEPKTGGLWDADEELGW